MNNKHFLVLSLLAQSHINPTLQFAKVLTRHGAKVTFATTTSGFSRLNNLPTVDGLSYATFPDGNGNNEEKVIADEEYVATLRRVGPQNVTKLVKDLSTNGPPVTFIVYAVLLPWVAEVARDLHIPSALLFIQCGITFSIYQRYFNSQSGLHHQEGHKFDPNFSIKLSGLPLFTCNDLPDFFSPKNKFHKSLIPVFREHIQTLEKETNPCVLANTFHALEKDFLNFFPSVTFFPIGPLLPSAFTDKNDMKDKAYGGNLFRNSIDYVTWLDSKPKWSVVYVSFGSILVLQDKQQEEILQGLVESGYKFLWVIRDIKVEEIKCLRQQYGISEEVGLIVPWCTQVEVLCHQSIGCFLTHCGWNSTMESLVSGVPVIGCPNFSEQKTNMKIVEEVWRNGVRVVENEEGVFVKDEIRRCLDVVMGEGKKGEKIRANALKWKGLAEEAVKEGGSSYKNLKQFLEM